MTGFGEEATYAELARRLRRAVEEQGWTQAQLADALGVQQQAVSKWLSGSTRPKPATLERLGSRLGLDIGELFRLAGYLEVAPTANGRRQPAAASGLSIPANLTPGERAVIEAVLDGIRARRRRRS